MRTLHFFPVFVILLSSLAGCTKSLSSGTTIGKDFTVTLFSTEPVEKESKWCHTNLDFSYSPASCHELRGEVISDEADSDLETVILFTGEGTGTIRTKVRDKGQDCLIVSLRITESGPGVKERWSKSNEVNIPIPNDDDWWIVPDEPEEGEQENQNYSI